MEEFWLSFLPLFVAVDAIGVLPLYIGLTEGLDEAEMRRIVLQSVATAGAVALLFLALGRAVLGFLGVTLADFLIAGGTLLFLLSLYDLSAAQKHRRGVDPESLGAVPLGVPLIVGPAVLSTLFVLVADYGARPVVPAILANIALAGAVFWFSSPINRVLGKAGSKAISKLAAFLLAAIAVTMVRRGLMMLLEGSF